MSRVVVVGLLMTLCTTALGCYTRSDCNDHGNCFNGQCQCDPGYSPPTCTGGGPHPCQSRADCSSHGNCLNGECLCDAGWSGPTCSKATCPHLQCQHGSVPAADCSACECIGCWSGANCTTFPSSPPPACASGIQSIAASGKAYASSLSSGLPLPPIPGWRFLGFGANGPSDSFGGVPLFLLNFTYPEKTWTAPNGSQFLEPEFFDVTDVDPSGTGQPIIKCTHSATVASLYASDGSTLSGSVGLPGLAQPKTIQSSFFSHANTLTVCTAQFPLYKASLPSGTPLSRYGQELSYSLPPSYSASSDSVFESLFDSAGTNAVTSVTMGGVVVVAFQHGGCLTSQELLAMQQPTIESQMRNAMGNIVVGKSWDTGLDGTVVTATHVVSTTLVGGNPETKLPEWQHSLLDNPVPITWEFANLFDVFPQPQSSVLQEAVDNYAAQAHASLVSKVQSATALAHAEWMDPQQMWIAMDVTAAGPIVSSHTWSSVTPTTLKSGGSSSAANSLGSVKPNPFLGFIPPPHHEDDDRHPDPYGTCIRDGDDDVDISKLVAGGCSRDSTTGGAVATALGLPDGSQTLKLYQFNIMMTAASDCPKVKDKDWEDMHDDKDVKLAGGNGKSKASPPVPACALQTSKFTLHGHEQSDFLNVDVTVTSRCCIGATPVGGASSTQVKCTPM